MKKVLLREVLDEKMRTKPDTHYIQRLQKAVDSETEFTLSVFKDTGRLMWVNQFDADYPDQTIHEDCTDVMVYIGGLNIQMLKSGAWFLYLGQDEYYNDEIFPLEKILFDYAKQEFKL